ncbi:MAG: primosomal protein N' [Chloroflexi bacterium]|nr:primosomal protein N' [Chloroflexota bacterium]
MREYIEIAVNVPRVSGVFHYHSPKELEGRLLPGHLVLVPFGAQIVQGVVLGHVKEAQVPETKAVLSLLDEQPALTTQQLALAEHISQTTLSPLAACVGLMLPPVVGQAADVRYGLAVGVKEFDGQISQPQRQLLDLLEARGPLRGRQLDKALPRRNWRSTIAALVKNALVESEPVLPRPRVRPKTVRTAQLASNPHALVGRELRLGQTDATQERRALMIQALAREAGPVDVSWLYAESGGNLQDLYKLEEMDLIRLSERETLRDPVDELAYDPSQPLTLTTDQQEVWEAVHKSLVQAWEGQAVKPMLLHGVTSSGKTEIYLQAVAKTLALGRQAIVLVPEIALTPQAVRRFQGRFPGQVGLLHSELSEGERYDTWRRARAGHLPIIVGPRSALFAPLQDIGLIVVDESHDDSYYEAGQTPHYHARRAAIAYAKMTGALCLMGSATPDVASRYRAEKGAWQLAELPGRILAHRETAAAHQKKFPKQFNYQRVGEQVEALPLPPVDVVDMRRELRQGNRSIFSHALQEGLAQALAQGQQAILFLNRRGTATYVFCRDCGDALQCPNCEMPLTQHVNGKSGPLAPVEKMALLCHHCGYARNMPTHCPNCNSARIRAYGSGTQNVEQQIEKLFPEARTLRWDRESTRRKGSHDRILRDFSEGRADILIGTQMLAKGLDLPLITLVGVVLADVGLHMPDYRAPERVFQVLTQVAGRAGRSPLGGQVVLQTFHPDHYVIQAAAKHDYEAFYHRETAERRRLRFPPFAQIVRLLYSDTDARKAEQDAKKMAATVGALLRKQERGNTDLIGPVPCFYARLNRRYRWQIVLRGPDPVSVLRGVKFVGWQIEVNPPSLL